MYTLIINPWSAVISPPVKSMALALMLLSMTANPASSAINPVRAKTLEGWRVLAPLPDKVGYAGMFAGVIAGRLVAGGGSQFPDRPLWLNGQKTYSDRVFVLTGLDGEWSEAPVKLPRPMAHFAVATAPEAIYIAGGCDERGSLREVYAIKATPAAGLGIHRLPDLPEPIVYAAAAVVNGRLYVAGGQTVLGARLASAAVLSLDLTELDNGWKREPDLPGGGTFIGTMAAHDKELFFIGGVGFDETGKSVQSPGLWQLDSRTQSWVPLPEMPEPRVGAVAPCPVLEGGRIFVIGGYAAAFPGERREHPGFSRQTFVYHIAQKSWAAGPKLPHLPPTDRDATGDAGPAPMVAAPSAVWNGHVVVVGGEVRASVRTPAVIAWPLAQSVAP
ncbi:MAG: hypothetical protein KIT44_15540 [Opitutaceae bacterium]|nr:hypothetical protein [Opitutaceae bacterium]